MHRQHPLPGFHFNVKVLGLPGATDDLRFTDVSGLSLASDAEDRPVASGGRCLKTYPRRTRFTDLVLRHGLLRSGEVWTWVERCTDTLLVEPMDLDVTLLNGLDEPVMTWHVLKAWPVRWAVSEIKAVNNSFVVDSLQLGYQCSRVDRCR